MWRQRREAAIAYGSLAGIVWVLSLGAACLGFGRVDDGGALWLYIAYAVAALVFVVVVLPLSDNWGTMSAPMFGWGTLFAVFAVVAIATWAIFRRRVSSSSRADAAPPRRGRR